VSETSIGSKLQVRGLSPRCQSHRAAHAFLAPETSPHCEKECMPRRARALEFAKATTPHSRQGQMHGWRGWHGSRRALGERGKGEPLAEILCLR
jgi:hypothetical protein